MLTSIVHAISIIFKCLKRQPWPVTPELQAAYIEELHICALRQLLVILVVIVVVILSDPLINVYLINGNIENVYILYEYII